MLPILAFVSVVAGTIAAQGTSTFHPPVARPFIDIDFFVGWPVNTTAPNGLIAVTPNAAGTITGRFNGHIVENTTASVERFYPADTGPGVYSEYINEILLATEDDENVLLKMSGTAMYANGGLHGFAYARFETVIANLSWINYGMFVAEWVGNTNSGTGNAKVQVFEILSGGRLDGQPIAAINTTDTSA
ncbi:uncharacterized protein Z518_10418 [Rhinocladiella mackenziei CBS 650.93]|uniref:Uncharacterized protein n=1 Tax=Rhinocladiella mackenziei CBS 650.93 TaxID=1442369 RepID=A0A0D2I3C8_9EURO|nr:uncharacterized protein Z518_10418 [Rhinocladiella mackenziei CBS 650.93]KIX00279.1 hypothetical protein Z518_10418 [Rhinocladiella mackenziei CBS 650.93]